MRELLWWLAVYAPVLINSLNWETLSNRYFIYYRGGVSFLKALSIMPSVAQATSFSVVTHHTSVSRTRGVPEALVG